MRRVRGWRKPPFPVLPYAGPWPTVLEAAGLQPGMTPALWAECLRINGAHLVARCLRPSWGAPLLWRLKSWPPKDLITADVEPQPGAEPQRVSP
jgi:hypothetical protein